jgi:hypothetical protein
MKVARGGPGSALSCEASLSGVNGFPKLDPSSVSIEYPRETTVGILFNLPRMLNTFFLEASKQRIQVADAVVHHEFLVVCAKVLCICRKDGPNRESEKVRVASFTPEEIHAGSFACYTEVLPIPFSGCFGILGLEEDAAYTRDVFLCVGSLCRLSLPSRNHTIENHAKRERYQTKRRQLQFRIRHVLCRRMFVFASPNPFESKTQDTSEILDSDSLSTDIYTLRIQLRRRRSRRSSVVSPSKSAAIVTNDSDAEFSNVLALTTVYSRP